MFNKKTKITVKEFAEVLSFFILREVRDLIKDEQKLESMGLNKNEVSKFFIDLIIIHTYSTCEAFNSIKIQSRNRNMLLDLFHKDVISRCIEKDDEFDELHGFLVKRYEQYHSIKTANEANYLTMLGGAFFRNLSGKDADAISVFKLNRMHINMIGIIQDAYPKYKIYY